MRETTATKIKMADKLEITKIKPRTSKQIVQAGFTLGAGMAFLPFIPFKKAKNYQPFKKKK